MATAVTAKAHKHIRRYLDTARTKWVMLRFLEGSLKVLAVTGIVVLLSFLADNALTLSPWLRGSLLGVCIVVFLGGLGREMFLLTYRVPSDESMARIIEKKHPDLDNRVINSVMLSKKELSGGAAMIVSSLVNSTAATVDRFDLRGIVNVKRLRQFAVAAVLVLVLLVGYGFAMPQHFGNAFKRFIMPFKYVPPITDTRIAVEPGDITVGYGRPVDIIARVSGEMPSVVTVYFRVKGKGDFISKEMEFNGQDFIHSFTSVTDDIQYYVIAGDAKSPRFLLDSVVVPSVARLDIEFTFPDFTFLGTKVLKEASGAITALKDTRVKLIGTSNVTLGNASIVLNDEKTLTVPTEGKNFTAEFTVETDGFYIIRLQDVEGVRNENPSRHPITLIADKNPEVRIIRPHAEVTTSPEREVIISFQAADDFGLKWIEVAYRLNAGEEQIADHWELKPGTKISVDQHVWNMGDFKAGDNIAWFLRVKDSGGNAPIVSTVMNIMVVNESELRKKQTGLMEDLQVQLAALLRMQKEARGSSDKLQAMIDAAETDDFGKLCEPLEGKQAAVRLRCKTIVDWMTDPIFETLLMKQALQRLRSGPMVTVMESISALKSTAFDEKRAEVLGGVMATQDIIIRELEKLLERLPSIINQLKEGKSAEDIAEELPEKKMEWYKQKLLEFIEEQRKVVEMTRELERIPPEDWTEREEEMQREIEAIEEKWQKFFEENRDDFSKLPFQDFSDGRQVDEFVEIYQAVTKAYEAIKDHGHEIAVPLEQAGAEKAEELVHNIEAWLPDTPDRDKWSMEEPLTQDEIPMAELPEELEDIVGDLIEEEEDMADDVEDVSSSWADSLDEGAGWDCQDGPISNMSAKGKTGNRMPNNNEIAGRSGEGRSGKSSGQFVEKSATGKGGRETPTRLTKDPFESGEVDDRSEDPVSGSSGGGKVSGQGGQGLQGPPPPEVDKEMGRLAGNQAELMSRAEKLLHELRKRRFPTKDVERAIEEIKEIEKQLREGAHQDLSARIRSVVKKLRDAEKAIGEQVKINRERRRNLPERDREGINSATDDSVPPDYKELVEEYYRALAEEGKKKE